MDDLYYAEQNVLPAKLKLGRIDNDYGLSDSRSKKKQTNKEEMLSVMDDHAGRRLRSASRHTSWLDNNGMR